MSVPCLIINGVDYAPFVLELKPTGNGLSADGSGRDTQTGEMFRTKVADKLTFDVSLGRMYEDIHRPLCAALELDFYRVTVLNPGTNTQVTGTFFTETRPFGSQRYDKSVGKTYYDGMAFKMTEK